MQQKLYYFCAALALVGVLAWVITSSNPKIRKVPVHLVTVTPVESLAFGSLTPSNLIARSALSTTASTVSKDIAVTTPSAGIAVPSTSVTYSYDAGDFSLPTLPVLRRDVVPLPTGTMSSLLTATRQIALSSFSHLTLDSFTVTEQGQTGYAITVDARRGVASLYRQSTTVTDKLSTAPTTNVAVTPLSSDQALHIANQFLSAHGISTAQLGAPVVEDSTYDAPSMKAVDSMPYSISTTVVYPWQVDGVQVVDQGGNPYGLQISIDPASHEVSDVNNITDFSFTGSDYPLVTDTATVLSVAKHGGVYGSGFTEGVTSAVPLAVPIPVYMVSSYQLSNDGTDYLVPALMFTVKTMPSGVTFYQRAVVVPLLESFLTPDTTTSQPSATSSSSDNASSGVADPALSSNSSVESQ